MWSSDGQWIPHDPVFEADDCDPGRASGPWAGHRWFAYDLLRYRSPQTIVELGTHYGVSLFAMAQAVKDGSLPVRLHAVDTWEGDPHAGEYGPEVLAVFERVRNTAYPNVSVTLHQMLFDEALPRFPDESVDLLHIDGYHSYEAVQHDFETWLPKLAPGALVLFHDVAPETGYGSADYWVDVTKRFPGFAFPHSFGLGALFPRGLMGWDYFWSDEFQRWKAYYPVRWEAFLRGLQVRDHILMVEERDKAIAAQEATIIARDEAVAAQEAAIIARDEAIATQTALIDERDAVIRDQDDALRERQRLEDLEVHLHAAKNGATRSAGLARRAMLTASRAGGQAGGRLARLALGRRVREQLGVLFDADYYLRRYPDVANAGLDPLTHYLQAGGREGRDPSPFFSGSFYLSRNHDVLEAGSNPLVHYIRHGAREGRAPSRAFDPAFYRASYPDAALPGVNPLVHYITTGLPKGRFVSAEHRHRVMARSARRTVPVVLAAGRRSVDRVSFAQPGVTPLDLPLSALQGVDADLVTVDVWDTLIGRYRPADSPKLATARRLFLRYRAVSPIASPWQLYDLRVAIEAEFAASRDHQEYHLVEVLDEVVRRTVPTLDDERRGEVAEDESRMEWDDEIATTYPLSDVWGMLARLRARPNPPRIAVASDFYFGAEDVRALLRHHGWTDDTTQVLVSWEHEASKRLGGGLLMLLRDRANVPAERHLHIGDNRHADYEMQLQSGGQAALLRLTPSPFPGPGQLAPARIRECVDTLRARLDEMADFQVEFAAGGDQSRRARAAGVASSLLAVAVVARAIEAADERGLDRIHYLSREGAFLARVHEAVAEELTRGTGSPLRAVHLEVSRRATFGASLASENADGLNRMWSMYGAQSVRAMLVSVGAQPEAYARAARTYGLDLDTTLADIATEPRVHRFLNDPDVQRLLGDTINQSRNLLLDYLRQQTDVDAPTWLVVDVGWRGSIQDNLAGVLPHAHFHGVYLGLFPFLNPQPDNCTKEAVGFDGNLGEDYAFAEPPAAVERPWTPHVPSTIGYERAADGRVHARYAQETRVSPLIDDFQDGLLAAAPAVARFLSTFGFTVPMLRSEVARDLGAYYETPFGGTADIWFGSEHDDTFGALNVTPFGKDAPDASWLSEQGAARYATAAAGSRWEPGFSQWLPVAALQEFRHMIEEST